MPISVIIPVYQASFRLQEHLKSLESLADVVQELIWVITTSPDASCQEARKAARRLGGTILERPPGLYPAWNAGLATAKSDFIYISTCGDVIHPQGLLALHDTLQKTQADLVISPPKIHPIEQRTLRLSRDWPVFRFASLLHKFAGRKIPSETAILIQILCGASSILGSCASCLFRASVFKRSPFPDSYFHYGDTAWIYSQLPHLSLAFHPEPVADFWFDEPDAPRIVEKRQIYAMMETLASHLPKDKKEAVGLLIEASRRLDGLRGEKPRVGWWWRLSAWIYRWQRQRSRKFLLQCLQKTVTRYPDPEL